MRKRPPGGKVYMQFGRDRLRRIKLSVAGITLCAVFVIAGVQQRKYAAAAHSEKFDATPSERARTNERPVFGRAPSPIAEDPSQPSATEQAESTDKSLGKGDPSADVLGFLERWRITLERGDLLAHAETYAPRLERFFTKRGVTREQVLREKQALMSKYPEVRTYRIRDVKMEAADGERAVVSFRKDWDMGGPKNRSFAGSERQRITLARSGGSWQIVREEETKVYWVRRG